MRTGLASATAFATAVGLCLGLAAVGPLFAADDKITAPMSNDKVRYSITCAGESESKINCEVRGIHNSKPLNGDEGQKDPPKGQANERILVLQADGDEVRADDGKHCWVKVNGLWYSIHC